MRNSDLGPVRINGVVELWDGWQLAVPNDCLAVRNADGSWSAWDDRHAVDISIVSATGRDGSALDAATMLGAAPNHHAGSWLGVVDEIADFDEQGSAYRLTITAAAPSTLLSCWISYREPSDRSWALAVCNSIQHAEHRQG